MSIRYTPPSPQNLRDLKERLNLSGKQMADLFGLASAQQWHKYCGGSEPREMSLPMLFLAGAVVNPDATVVEVFEWCRQVGASVDMSPRDA
ncbi:helix-turn-helix domain-containing protein [Paraburkholderia bannensis]|uniref:helix-turn-helix domain-containing protein n=1 Tax=Paraburkholderia bannensis TaxID=765414 RepID=UPI0005A9B289|nr:helix-turn-helix domain-containing protein [Paraburkholderia bannensis]